MVPRDALGSGGLMLVLRVMVLVAIVVAPIVGPTAMAEETSEPSSTTYGSSDPDASTVDPGPQPCRPNCLA